MKGLEPQEAVNGGGERLTSSENAGSDSRHAPDPRFKDRAAKAARGRADRAALRSKLARGAYIPDRVPQGARDAERGSSIEAATAVAGRSHDAISEDKSGAFGRKGAVADQDVINKVVRPEEEKALREWAQSSGHVLNDAAFEANWKGHGKKGGEENDVYLDPNDGRWYKRNNMGFHGNYLEYFHRLALHNWLFPSTALRFEGFVERQGKLQPVVSQADVIGSGSTREEVVPHMGNMKFAHITGTDNYVHNNGVMVRDLHQENVFVNQSGGQSIIDPVTMMDPETKMKRMRAAAKEPAQLSGR